MPPDTRYKNRLWVIRTNDDGTVKMDHVLVAVMMDIRDELWVINDRLKSEEFRKALDGLQALGRQARRRERDARARNKWRAAARKLEKKRK